MTLVTVSGHSLFGGHTIRAYEGRARTHTLDVSDAALASYVKEWTEGFPFYPASARGKMKVELRGGTRG